MLQLKKTKVGSFQYNKANKYYDGLFSMRTRVRTTTLIITIMMI
jgi:hypothetical protein